MHESFDDAECQVLAEFFTVFGNRTRLRMFCALQDGCKTVSELAEYADVTLQNASQHLRVMRDKGAVTTEKEGQRVYYTVVDERLIEAAKMMRNALVEAIERRAQTIGAGG